MLSFMRFLALLLLGWLPASAQGLFLWEAAGENGKAYLLGSIHLAKPEFYPLPDPVEDSFAASDALVVEIDLSPEQEAQMGAMFLAAGMYSDGRKLSGEVSTETMELLSAYLEERGLRPAIFDAMRPWMAAIAIQAAEMVRLGFDPQIGIDRHFMDQARDAGKPIRQLETPEFQLNLLSGFDEDLQEDFLHYTLRDLERTPEMMDGLVEAWRSGDAETMEAVLLQPEEIDESTEVIYEKMFFERNRAMAKKIAAMISEGGTYFVVVGAGHMVGDQGIPALLRAQFAVEQVRGASEAVAQ